MTDNLPPLPAGMLPTDDRKSSAVIREMMRAYGRACYDAAIAAKEAKNG